MCGISEIESTALTAITDFVNLCASETLSIEIAQILLAASLIPFRKNSSRNASVAGESDLRAEKSPGEV